MRTRTPLIVTGAAGRLGRLLRVFEDIEDFATFSTTWTARTASPGVTSWDMLGKKSPNLPKGGILLHLAGVLPGRGASGYLSDNAEMARTIVATDRLAPFAHVVFLSTVAVYAPQDGAIAEISLPDPQTGYGQAKLIAERALSEGLGKRLTILRLANLAGADALLGANALGAKVVLDPVAGHNSGPERSYIGPLTFAKTMAALLAVCAKQEPLPPVINLAQPGSVAMADLLRVSGRDWCFGPIRDGVVPKVAVDVQRLARICPLVAANAETIVAELQSLQGRWP